MNTVYSKYRVEFATTSGLMGSYIGDTLEDLYNAIESDSRLYKFINTDNLINILKYGYFKEFKNGIHKSTQYVIDNAIHFMWTVN